MVDTQYSFNGIAPGAEGQEREDEHRTGVPNQGAGTVLLAAPVKRTTGVMVANVGSEGAHLRLRHQGQVKTQTAELLVALSSSATKYQGNLQYKSLVPFSASNPNSGIQITNAGAPLTIVDDGAGNLYDVGFVGNAAHFRGTVDYVNGIINVTFGAAPTQPVAATYFHTDYTDFLSPVQTSSKAAAAYPFTFQLGFGRVNPGTVAYADGGGLTFVDDGKGNIIETTGGGAVKRGTIDYATGIITQTTGSAALSGTVTATYTFNPFAALMARAGSQKMLDIYAMIPELTGQAYANGVKGESFIGLWGETRFIVDAPPLGISQTNLVTQWRHFSEEPYRVNELFSGFPPGGEINDPTLQHTVNHL